MIRNASQPPDSNMSRWDGLRRVLERTAELGQPWQLSFEGCILRFWFIPHSIKHLHDACLEPIIGVGQGRGERFDGRFADLSKNFGRRLTNLIFFGHQQWNERRHGWTAELDQ